MIINFLRELSKRMEETGLPALLFLQFCSIVAGATMSNFDLKMHALKFNLRVLKLIPQYL